MNRFNNFENFINEGLFTKDYNVTLTDVMMGIHVTYHIHNNGIVKKITGQMNDEFPINVGDKITWKQLQNILKDNTRLSMKWNKHEVESILKYGNTQFTNITEGPEKTNQKIVNTPRPNISWSGTNPKFKK